MTGEAETVPARTAIVLYGTETGTSQDLAYESSRILERHHIETDVDELDNVTPLSFAQYDLVVFVLATTGQGEFPSNARKLWTSLRRKKLTSTFLSSVQYVLVGLGDTSYPKFNWAARKLHKRLEQLGAMSLLDPCEADEQGEDSTDGAFIAWSQSFKSMLLKKFPLPHGSQPIPDGELLPSKWKLCTVGSDGIDRDDTNGHGKQLLNGTSRPAEVTFNVVLTENTRVTPEIHWQDVRLIRLKAQESVEYHPGDAIAIRPMNSPSDVQELIRLMHWDSVADEPLRYRLQKHKSRSQQLPESIPLGPITLRKILTERLDINAIPRRSFFSAIAHYTANDMHRERLLEFTDPQFLDEYYDYATRPRRSILEILQEFDSVQIPWQEVINVLPVLRPRQFSIASGGDIKEGGHAFELLVAIVKYRTVIKRIREGVCTKYLAGLPVGSTLEVALKTEGRFHTQAQLAGTDHLLLGAGTGIAPLRAVIQEKHALLGPNRNTTLVFGCRNAGADYFFKDEWEDLMKKKVDGARKSFHTITAFSRDQQQKVYVQDRIRENAQMIRDYLLGTDTTIIVCGSSGAMPKAIRQAFVDVLTEQRVDRDDDATFSTEEAESFLARLEKEGRYKQETW